MSNIYERREAIAEEYRRRNEALHQQRMKTCPSYRAMHERAEARERHRARQAEGVDAMRERLRNRRR